MKRAPRARWFELEADDVLGELGAAPSFLGRFTPEKLRGELEAAGLIDGLLGCGYERVRVRMDQVDAEHRLFVAPERGRVLLLDLRAAEEGLVASEPWMAALGGRAIACLAVRWLALQHPRASFHPDKPRLPGQRYPGLGLGRRVYALLRSWVAEFGKDALLNQPAYFHNALFYAESFRFVSAARQGEFEALRRDLGHLSPAGASWAVEKGHVQAVERDGTRRRLRWEPAPMIDPRTDDLQDALGSRAYADLVAASRDAVRFDLVKARRSRSSSNAIG